MSELRAFTKAAAVPWAILPDSLQQIFEIAAREHLPDFDAVAARRARRMDGAEGVQVRAGVAVISITGPIFRYADFFTDISGGATVSSLARDFTTAIENPDITAILLNIDSPGGEVAGIHEFAQMVFDARGKKPIVAYADGLAASAAYWIASATDEIVADATAMLGSIGVVAAVPNPAIKSAREIQFVSSQSPRKRPDPTTETGKAQLQELVDSLAEVFVSTIARNRAVSEETVLAEFGQGGVMVGQKAVAAGLADRLGSFEQTLAELSAGKWKKRKNKMASADEETDMTISEQFNRIKERVIAAFDPVPPEGGVTTAPTVSDNTSQITIDLTPQATDQPGIDTTATDEMRREIAALRLKATEADADRFIAEQIAAGRILPAESDATRADYLQAASDDAAMPMAEGSRIATLKSRIEARPSHRLTEELVVGPEHRILRSDENNQTEMSEERKRQLLEMTGIGKAALSIVK